MFLVNRFDQQHAPENPERDHFEVQRKKEGKAVQELGRGEEVHLVAEAEVVVQFLLERVGFGHALVDVQEMDNVGGVGL